jgi:citrate synthase
MAHWLTAAEAASELGIAPASLYAYVSRGLIRSAPQPGTRAKLYDAQDVHALRHRTAGGSASSAEAWHPLTLETATTLIHEDRLFYRGVDVARLAETARFEAVAALLWGADSDNPFAQASGFAPIVEHRNGGPVTRMLADLAWASERDPAGFARTGDAIMRTGARILHQLVTTIAGTPPSGSLAAHLAAGWGQTHAEPMIRSALIVMADHELAASTFAVRVAASTGASPWRAVSAGLACLDGPRHGGVAERVTALIEAAEATPEPRTALAARLRRGEDLPGFGHPLYRGIDPRARLMIAAARRCGDTGIIDRGEAIAAAARNLIGRDPNLDFGLVVAARACGLPPEAPIALFAIARTAGWIAHIIEQSREPDLIRPRARYVGLLPD